MNRLALVLLGAAALAACATGSGPGGSANGSGARGRDGAADPDVVRLTNGEVVRGRVVEENSRQVLVDRDSHVSMYPRSAVYSVDYSKDGRAARGEKLRPSEAPPASVPPASSWYPRTDARDPVKQEEVLWYDRHGIDECMGSGLAECLRKFPEIRLFAVPGGRIVLHDPRKWGYHAHVWPGDRLEKPAGKPGLEIAIPEKEADLPEAVAFVSPAQEMRSLETPDRASYAVPDALYAVIRPAGQADGMLAVQPFAGGRPAATRNGSLWAFALPRNSSHFLVYLLDAERKHGEILKSAFAAYGDTVLAADLMIDVAAPDGAVVSRILVVPFPNGLSADGPAPEPVTICSGPTGDPTAVAAVAVPPRQAVQLPARPPSTKADILVSHYEVAQGVPQSVVIAHGTGRPAAGMSLIERELTPQTADELVKIDLSSLPEERFPAVAWFYHRRTFAWRTTGGYLPPAQAQSAPLPAEVKLTRAKRGDPIPHVVPILFQGPRPRPASGGQDAAAGVAGGMSGALMQDALAREAGRNLTNLTTNLNPAPNSGAGGSGMTSVTNVYISSPTHTPAMEGSSSGGFPSWASGRYMSVPSGSLSSPMGTFDPTTGRFFDSSGQMIWDPRMGGGGSINEHPDFQFIDMTSGAGVKFNRRSR